MFKGKISRPGHGTVVAYTALVFALGGGTAYAATTAFVHLGAHNTEHLSTTISRTAAGPALSLNVTHASAPLAVNSNKLVGNLNAQYVGGKSASSFQPKISRLNFTPLTPINGWRDDCFTGHIGAAISVDGVVHLRGDICASSASSELAFVLPPQFRPSTAGYLYLTADQDDNATGRIEIDSSGDVYVESDPQSSAAGEGFTSLEGITYALPY